MKEFHIKKHYRDLYHINAPIAFFNNRVIFVSLTEAKKLAEAMNRNLQKGEKPVLEQDIFGMALIEEINHFLIKEYSKLYKNGVLFLNVIDNANLTKESLDKTLLDYTEEFPPYEVYTKQKTAREYLASEINLSNEIAKATAITLEEMLLLSYQNKNPAFRKVAHKLFSDEKLKNETSYNTIVNSMEVFLTKKEMPHLEEHTIIDILQEPINLHPESVQDQLSFLIKRWGHLLAGWLREKAELGLAFLEETARYFEAQNNAGHRANFDMFKGIEDYSGYLNRGKGLSRNEYEAYTSDSEWMPSSIMIAKFTLVWLVQLSDKYNKKIETLDQIPDEEIALLRNRGFTILWLIGIWERSHASRRIQQLKNNPEAESSAYAITKYGIYSKLGGWDSFLNFKDRCRKFGIKLAGDMVPNHTAMDSEWVYYHPDRFVHTKEKPSNDITFTGENLSSHPGVEIRLEDGYYDETRASVVFQRIDRVNNDVRYIYHGNDGTLLPWNDTAQINLLNKEAYDALISEIISISRNFPVIRLDAAMTFVNQHYKRLWYPNPGDREIGPPIPTRLEKGYMTADEYKNAMPHEFWRDLIDRLNQENPDTLLIAEAFWQLEGYFVRTLGMHRVYMSAFMKMLYKKENQKYKNLIKETLEYDKEILKRYVNFMSNPDEEPAIEQFGDGDFYFGVTTMLATLPGFPMFGHGQIEGLREKYGMKYAKPYKDEQPNQGLIDRHEFQIFPLLRMRQLFSEIKYFNLYDFFRDDGSVNENVFAYSNKFKNTQSLIVFNNNYDEEGHGYINLCAWYVDKHGEPGQRHGISHIWGLHNDDKHYVILPNFLSKKERIVPSWEIVKYGLNFKDSFKLGRYGLFVFIGVHEVEDVHGVYKHIYETHKDREVDNVGSQVRRLRFGKVYDAVTEFLSKEVRKDLFEAVTNGSMKDSQKDAVMNAYLTNLKEHGATAKTFETSYNMVKNLGVLYKKSFAGEKEFDENFEQVLTNQNIAEFIVLSMTYPILNKEWSLFLELDMGSANLEYLDALVDDDLLEAEIDEKNMLSVFKSLKTNLLGLNNFDGKQFVVKESLLRLLRYMLIFQAISSKNLTDASLSTLKSRFAKVYEVVKKAGFSLTPLKEEKKASKKEEKATEKEAKKEDSKKEDNKKEDNKSSEEKPKKTKKSEQTELDDTKAEEKPKRTSKKKDEEGKDDAKGDTEKKPSSRKKKSDDDKKE